MMRTRRLRIGCELDYLATVETPAVFQVQPNDAPRVTIKHERWTRQPLIATSNYTDLYGNRCMRATLLAGASNLRYDALVEVPDAEDDSDEDAPGLPPALLPDHVLIYTLPSRYCLPDVLGSEAWTRFGAIPAGFRQVQAICTYVHRHLTFQYGSSNPQSTAADVNATGLGVCRDFTHLAISFCRALNIPARYACGYLPDMDVPANPAPMDFSAWMEVWLGERWWTIDPRHNRRRKGRVVVGRGRDASDVAIATTFGGPQLVSMTVRAEEVPPGEIAMLSNGIRTR